MGLCFILCDDEASNLYVRMCFSLQVSHLGLDAAREATKNQNNEITFEAANAEPDGPKEGAHDDKQHSGGNSFAGGVSAARDSYMQPDLTTVAKKTGGRDTAGMGGRGGYKRLFKGGDITQVGP